MLSVMFPGLPDPEIRLRLLRRAKVVRVGFPCLQEYHYRVPLWYQKHSYFEILSGSHIYSRKFSLRDSSSGRRSVG